MSKEDLDALLERMPKIAEAANAFSSEAVQQEAFKAMVAAFSGEKSGHKERVIHVSKPHDDEQDVEEIDQGQSDERGKKGAGRKKRANGKSSWSLNKNLDLHPQGKASFEDFLATKQLTTALSDQDMIAAIVYYLSEILELPATTIDDVGTVIRRTPARKEPTNLPSVLRNAQSRKSTIDCSDLQNIKLTSAGRNFVEHSLPLKVKAKK